MRKPRIFPTINTLVLALFWLAFWLEVVLAAPLDVEHLPQSAQPVQPNGFHGLNVDVQRRQHRERALGDIFDTLNYGGPTLGEHRPEPTHAANGQASTNTAQQQQQQHVSMTTLPDGLLEHITISGTSTSPTASATAHSQSVSTTATGKYSVIGTIPPVPSPTAGNTIMTSFPSTPTYTDPASTSSVTAHPASSSKEQTAIKQWKIIGVAVIAFSTVAAILLLAVFFDQWWKFVNDMFGRRKKRMVGDEELVPDWEKASWEVRFGDDRHRYPSFSSFPSERDGKGAGLKGKGGVDTGEEGGSAEQSEVGWVRPKGSPLGLVQTQAQDQEHHSVVGTGYATPAGYANQEMDISTMSSYHNPSGQYPSHTTASTYASPRPPAPAMTRSRSQHSQRNADPFNDPPPPRSPGMKSLCGESVYGGIAE